MYISYNYIYLTTYLRVLCAKVVYIWIAKVVPQHLLMQLFDFLSYEDISEDQVS